MNSFFRYLENIYAIQSELLVPCQIKTRNFYRMDQTFKILYLVILQTRAPGMNIKEI